jgi:hypothetical protein
MEFICNSRVLFHFDYKSSRRTPAAAFPPLRFIVPRLPPSAHAGDAQGTQTGQRRHACALYQIEDDYAAQSHARSPPSPMEKPEAKGKNGASVKNEDFGGKTGVPP